MIAQPYLRVSTADKGQNPARQMEVLDAWALREGITLLPPVIDEGTSATFTDPFERPRFLEALERAQRGGARAIVAEMVDRVCGQGGDELGFVKVMLRREYRLEFWTADQPVSLHGSLAGNLLSQAKAEIRRDAMSTQRVRIKGGIATRKRAGKPIGGQTQAKVGPELVGLVRAVVVEHPEWGCRRIAREVSSRRGSEATSITERERRKRKVTHETVRRALLKLAGRAASLTTSEDGASATSGDAPSAPAGDAPSSGDLGGSS